MKEATLDGAVRVAVGEPFRVALRAEGATGRRWDFTAPDAIAVIETVTEPSRGFGARPLRWHVFECRVPGEYKIDLRLHRPWEDAGEHHLVSVVCEGGPD